MNDPEKAASEIDWVLDHEEPTDLPERPMESDEFKMLWDWAKQD